MDVDKELREAEKTGKVVFGTEEVLKTVRTGDASIVFVSRSCPDSAVSEIDRLAEIGDISLKFYDGNGEDLGLALGKPFLISAVAVVDSGDSSILETGD